MNPRIWISFGHVRRHSDVGIDFSPVVFHEVRLGVLSLHKVHLAWLHKRIESTFLYLMRIKGKNPSRQGKSIHT